MSQINFKKLFGLLVIGFIIIIVPTRDTLLSYVIYMMIVGMPDHSLVED